MTSVLNVHTFFLILIPQTIHANNCAPSTDTVLGIIHHPEMTESLWEGVCRLETNTALLYKTLEHPWILVPTAGVLRPNPTDTEE
jgi:hypothetical protein